MEKHWTEAKLPQWVRDGIEADLAAYKVTMALAWPTEARPEPLPFCWGDYDRLSGNPEAGMYWAVSGHVRRIEIRPSEHWKKWEFKSDGGNWTTGVTRGWTTGVTRGPLFRTEREAHLWRLWERCEICAQELAVIRAKM